MVYTIIMHNVIIIKIMY